MKTKKFNKKLALNKNTIANLRSQDMNSAKGGIFTDDTCDSCYPPTYCLGCPTLICEESEIRPCG
jgi:natural product precursor